MAIKINHLTHIYNPSTPFEKIALEDINLEIKDGDFVGIIGHTGSGKSTLIQMFNGLIKPTSGEVIIKGQDIHHVNTDKKKIRQQVGLVFQYPEYQLFEMTVFEDVAFGPKNMGLKEEKIKERVHYALSAVDISEQYYDMSPFELSGGQKRRVAIAGVLAMKPDTLILDEPTAGLDPKGRDALFSQLKQMHEELGLTIVLISHSMEDIAKYAKNVIVLDHGKIAYEGTTREVFAKGKELEEIGLGMPQIRYILDLLKSHGMAIDTDVLTVEEAANVIKDYLRKEGGTL